ncbi:MAG: glycosyltransferase [Chloroflexi bacterium]|nr:glycosyltransferase [Chloroflexota bacterium]
MLGVAYGYFFSEIFFESNKPEMVETIFNGFKLLWLVPLPYAVLNFYSFIRYPVFSKPQIEPINESFENTLYFRYITRGLNQTLVDENVTAAYALLESVLPNGGWMIEVVTDNPLSITLEGERVHTVVVPDSYRPPNGSKFKARALHYALHVSTAVAEDWIIHLDEETQFDEETVRSIHHFAKRENEAVAAGKQTTPRIGQGVILYGARQVVNWWTTFADSIRVGDDYGRFRLQFEHGKAYFGMHGSYIVVRNSIEKLIGLANPPKDFYIVKKEVFQ